MGLGFRGLSVSRQLSGSTLRVLWGVGFEDVEVEAALNLNPKCRNPGPRLDDVSRVLKARDGKHTWEIGVQEFILLQFRNPRVVINFPRGNLQEKHRNAARTRLHKYHGCLAWAALVTSSPQHSHVCVIYRGLMISEHLE